MDKPCRDSPAPPPPPTHTHSFRRKFPSILAALIPCHILHHFILNALCLLYIDKHIYISDIDECLGNHGCADEATCKNSPGSYQCLCKNGYYGGGKICEGTMLSFSLHEEIGLRRNPLYNRKGGPQDGVFIEISSHG